MIDIQFSVEWILGEKINYQIVYYYTMIMKKLGFSIKIECFLITIKPLTDQINLWPFIGNM